MSTTSSINGDSIKEQKRILIKNPDGTFMHCLKTSNPISSTKSTEKSPLLPTTSLSENSSTSNDFDNLTISDSALDYLVENPDEYGSNFLLSKFITSIKANLIIFSTILLMDFFLSIFLAYSSWKKHNSALFLIQNFFYAQLSEKTSKIIFYVIFVLANINNLVYYSFGIYAIVNKNFRVFRIFAIYSIVNAVLNLGAAYFDIFFFTSFMVRVIMYPMAKYNANLIVSTIALPKKMHGKDYDTFNENN